MAGHERFSVLVQYEHMLHVELPQFSVLADVTFALTKLAGGLMRTTLAFPCGLFNRAPQRSELARYSEVPMYSPLTQLSEES